MTAAQAIEAVRSGVRVAGPYSIHQAETPGRCPGFNHRFRTLFCDGTTDVVECAVCGRQQTAVCNFDDEYA